MAQQDRTAKAEQIFAAVSAGQTVFTKAAAGWMVVGPTADVVEGRTVTVTKADGTTTQVRIADVTGTYEKRGLAYAVATFRNLPKLAATPARPRRPRRPRTVNHDFFGPGVQYGDGATVYDNGRTQIWDD